MFLGDLNRTLPPQKKKGSTNPLNKEPGEEASKRNEAR